MSIGNEVLAASLESLKAYMFGCLGDATHSRLHHTFRFGQRDARWLEVLRDALNRLGYRSWIYREGSERDFWVLETRARFLSEPFDPCVFVGSAFGLDFVRGFFDAEGGMPVKPDARLYVQLAQKDRIAVSRVRSILQQDKISCGVLHVPSQRADPNYWRFYVRARSHRDFFQRVRPWHPRKRFQSIERGLLAD